MEQTTGSCWIPSYHAAGKWSCCSCIFRPGFAWFWDTLWLFNIAMEAMAHLQMIFPLKPPFIMDFPVSYVKWPDGILRQHAEVMLKPPHSSFFLFFNAASRRYVQPKAERNRCNVWFWTWFCKHVLLWDTMSKHRPGLYSFCCLFWVWMTTILKTWSDTGLLMNMRKNPKSPTGQNDQTPKWK